MKKKLRNKRLNNTGKIILLALIVFSVYSCKKETTYEKVNYKGDSLILRKYFYDNGSIKKEETLNKDSLTHGYIKEYYPNGQLKDMTEYAEDKKNGKTIGYYSNGQLENIGRFDQGKEDSIWLWYYNDGKVKAKDSWLNGNAFGCTYKYYPNSKIKEFFFTNSFGNTIYAREYDQNGKVTSESGRALNVIHNKDSLKAGERFEAGIFAAIAPETSFNLEIVLKSKSGKIVSAQKVDSEEFEDAFLAKRYIYEKKMEQPGEYHFLSILHRIGGISKEVKRDTVVIKISVRK